MKSLTSGGSRLLEKQAWLLAILFTAAMTLFCVPRAAAQNDGVFSGQLLDTDGKPWADIVVKSVSDQGIKQEVKSDKNGNFVFRNLRAGKYTVYVQLPPPSPPYPVEMQVQGGVEAPKMVINFKDIAAKQGVASAAAQKKEQEDQDKFTNMKTHFEAGTALLAQVATAKAQAAKAPADQRAALKQQAVDLSGKAATELEAAKSAAPEKDPNLAVILAKLGDAYDAAGRSDDAVNAYQQAVALKPIAPYYNNLGSILGRAGKINEAIAAYQKSAELDPPNAAQAWRNLGITLYNANRLEDAAEPFQKSVALDPKNAQTWYLLGASLVAKMTVKKVGDKDEVQFAPGTIEAYQKAVELDPNGPWGQQAKEGLQQLQQIAPGIDVKLKRTPK